MTSVSPIGPKSNFNIQGSPYTEPADNKQNKITTEKTNLFISIITFLLKAKLIFYSAQLLWEQVNYTETALSANSGSILTGGLSPKTRIAFHFHVVNQPMISSFPVRLRFSISSTSLEFCPSWCAAAFLIDVGAVALKQKRQIPIYIYFILLEPGKSIVFLYFS
jgi:hypothetical protein